MVIYSFAYGSVFSLAPKKYRIGSMNIRARTIKRIPMMIFRETTLPRTLFAAL